MSTFKIYKQTYLFHNFSFQTSSISGKYTHLHTVMSVHVCVWSHAHALCLSRNFFLRITFTISLLGYQPLHCHSSEDVVFHGFVPEGIPSRCYSSLLSRSCLFISQTTFSHFEYHLTFLAFFNIEPTFSKASSVCQLCMISFPCFLNHNRRLIFIFLCTGSISAKTAMGTGRPLCSYSLKVQVQIYKISHCCTQLASKTQLSTCWTTKASSILTCLFPSTRRNFPQHFQKEYLQCSPHGAEGVYQGDNFPLWQLAAFLPLKCFLCSRLCSWLRGKIFLLFASRSW